MMDTLKLERRNLYRRQRVDLFEGLTKDTVQTTERTNGGFMPALIFAILFWTMVFIGCQLTLNVLDQTGAASGTSAFEQMVTSGIFADNGEQNVYVISLEEKIKSILSVVLPTMSLISITLVLLSLVSTVLYLFKQEYFDDVYLAKKAVQGERRKRSGGSQTGGGRFSAASNMFKGIVSGDAVVQYGIVKCYLMPNLKAWAFYEAGEGRMTVMDFLKKNALKCIMMFSFCILISDQTMLELFLKGAQVGTYVFERAAAVDYVTYIDNFLTTGTDYVPYYNTTDTVQLNKKKTYSAGYQVLKSLCDTNNAYERSTDFKTYMGQTLVDYIDNDMTQIPFDRENFVVKCEKIDYTSYTKVLSTTGQTAESHVVAVDSLFGGEYLSGSYLRFYFTTSLSANARGSVVSTTDVGAWSMGTSSFTGAEANSIVWDYAYGTNFNTGNAMHISGISSIEVEVMYKGDIYYQRFNNLGSSYEPIICTSDDEKSMTNDFSSGALVNLTKLTKESSNNTYVNALYGNSGYITYGSGSNTVPILTGFCVTPSIADAEIRSIAFQNIDYYTGTFNTAQGGAMVETSSQKGGDYSHYLNPNAASILSSQKDAAAN